MRMKDKKPATPEIEREIYDLCYKGKLGLATDIRRVDELFRTYPVTYIRVGNKASEKANSDYRKSLNSHQPSRGG